jgi:hypothetical protein
MSQLALDGTNFENVIYQYSPEKNSGRHGTRLLNAPTFERSCTRMASPALPMRRPRQAKGVRAAALVQRMEAPEPARSILKQRVGAK